jgi:hypothetical protein
LFLKTHCFWGIPHFKKGAFQRAAPGEASICCEHHSLAHNVDWRGDFGDGLLGFTVTISSTDIMGL